jgi:hypothetical protein
MVNNIHAAIKGKDGSDLFLSPCPPLAALTIGQLAGLETPRDQRKKQSKRQDSGKSGHNRQLADQLMTYMAKNIMEELDEADD